MTGQLLFPAEAMFCFLHWIMWGAPTPGVSVFLFIWFFVYPPWFHFHTLTAGRHIFSQDIQQALWSPSVPHIHPSLLQPTGTAIACSMLDLRPRKSIDSVCSIPCLLDDLILFWDCSLLSESFWFIPSHSSSSNLLRRRAYESKYLDTLCICVLGAWWAPKSKDNCLLFLRSFLVLFNWEVFCFFSPLFPVTLFFSLFSSILLDFLNFYLSIKLLLSCICLIVLYLSLICS